MQNNRIDFGEQSILLGCGDGKSEVLHIDTDNEEKKQDVICTMSGRGNQLSIYGLSISPNMTYMAAATRNRVNKQTGRLIPAELRVWIFDDLLNRHSQKLYMETFYARSALISVSVTDDGYLLVGSSSGELLLYELPGASPIITEQAYSGPVFAVAAIGSGKWVTIGGQGVLKIWEQTNTEMKLLWESAISVPVKMSALQSIAFSKTTEKVYWGDGSGNIYWVDTGNNSLENGSWKAHDGSVTALSWHSELEQLVSGGLNDGFVKAWTAPNELYTEMKVPIPVLGICSQVGKTILLLDATGKVSKVSLWDDSEIKFVIRAPFRSWVNFPIDIAVSAKRQSLASSIEEKIGLAEAAITAEQWGEARAFIDQLHGDGAGMQSLILLAKMHRARNQLLLEYHVWNELIKSELNDELYKIAHFGLADVLDKIVEPELALEHFKLAEGFGDATIRAQKMIEHPLFKARPYVRADLESKERFHQEVFKNVTLNRRFTSTVVLEQIESNITMDANGSSIEVLDELIKLHKDSYPITKELDIYIEEVRLLKGQDRAPETIKWLRFAPSAEASVGSWIQLALSIEKFGTQSNLLMYTLFNPEEIPYSTDDVQAWNNEVGRIWERTSSESDYSGWLSQVSDVIENKILRIHLGKSSITSF